MIMTPVDGTVEAHEARPLFATIVPVQACQGRAQVRAKT